MKDLLQIIICSIVLSLLLYWIFANTNDVTFIALSGIENNNINFNLLLSPENQNKPINLYYINMDKSIERKNRLLKRMSKYNNYNLIRVKAIIPEDLYNYNIEIPWHCAGMHNKEKSCLLSHFKAIEISYQNNDEYSIIAEDDMILEKNINWDYFISVLPKDWEIIQLYYFKLKFSNDSQFKYLQKKNFLIKTDNILTSAAAYLINKKGMKNILSRMKNKNINLLNHKILCLADFVIYNNIHRYILTYPIIKTEELDSTLNPHHVPLRKIFNIL